MIDYPIPTRMRRVFNGWLKGILIGQNFDRVLNLGCGHDIDREGGYYANYFGGAEVINVDCAKDTLYDEIELVYLKLYSMEIKTGSQGVSFFVVKNPLDRIAKAEALPFEDGYFDFVFCNWAFHDMDRMKSLFEMNRVLKMHGRIFISYCKSPISFMLETRRMIEEFFGIGTFMRLSLEEHLDGRNGSAEAIMGIKA